MSADRLHPVVALVGEARRAISKARYDAALELLEQAAMLAPDDQEVRRLLAQTEAASRRHQAAAERHQAVIDRGREIEALIERDELESARDKLRQAGAELGKHDLFSALDEKLSGREEVARRDLAAELAVKARELLDAGDRPGALKVAEQSLRFAPTPEAREIREQVNAELDEEAERRQHRRAVAEAADDVERLLDARELLQAGRRLRQANDQLGRHRAFDELGRRIDRAKSDLRFRQRVEWAERRSREADGRIADAARLSLKADYAQAIEQLEAARELDPSRPDLDGLLETARAAHERQEARRKRVEELDRRAAEITSHLDALRLDQAEDAIRRARELGEPERFAPLAARLRGLREVELDDREPIAAAPEDRQAEAEMLRRQQALAAAYSWKQTFLYPFRGAGPTVFWALLGAWVALDVLSAVPRIGFVFAAASMALLIVALGLVPPLVRATLAGRNLLPAPGELADVGRWARDVARAGILVAVAGLPFVILLATRPWHGAPSAASGPALWLAAAAAGWLAAAFLAAAAGAVEAFGFDQAPRLARHARALSAAGADGLLAIDVVFALGLFAVVLALAPAAPWLFQPLARALSAYGLLLVPHLIGVVVRRHRLELGKVYS